MARSIRKGPFVDDHLMNKVQALFVSHLERSGWPPSGLLPNADVFDTVIVHVCSRNAPDVVLAKDTWLKQGAPPFTAMKKSTSESPLSSNRARI